MKKIVLSLCLGAVAAVNAADFDVRDESEFKKCVPTGAAVEKLSGGFQFVEGPTWLSSEGGFLVFSDIPANQLKKWRQPGGVTTFREPSQNANGNTTDSLGRLVTAEHSGRRISLTERDGTVKTVVNSFEGKKFNSPNDVVVRSDGTYWFTDPDYGLRDKSAKELPGNYVFRYDPKDKSILALVKDFDKPNGVCFSPDEKKLYVADSGSPRHIRIFDVQGGNKVNEGKVFCKIDKGGPDGIRCDQDGRIWSSAGDGVHIFAPDGALIDKILVPEAPANLCFGGKDGRTLFITARKSLYSIKTAVGEIKRRQGVF